MNRGSHVTPEEVAAHNAASMRPRFMNRGSDHAPSVGVRKGVSLQ